MQPRPKRREQRDLRRVPDRLAAWVGTDGKLETDRNRDPRQQVNRRVRHQATFDATEGGGRATTDCRHVPKRKAGSLPRHADLATNRQAQTTACLDASIGAALACSHQSILAASPSQRLTSTCTSGMRSIDAGCAGGLANAFDRPNHSARDPAHRRHATAAAQAALFGARPTAANRCCPEINE